MAIGVTAMLDEESTGLKRGLGLDLGLELELESGVRVGVSVRVKATSSCPPAAASLRGVFSFPS